MNIEDLKDWERNTPHLRNVTPDEFQRQGGWCADTRNLLSAMRRLSPELIALWQSVNVLCYPPADCPATCLTQLAVVRENLDWLNSKLADL